MPRALAAAGKNTRNVAVNNSAIRNPKSKGCRIRIKIQGLPFTSDKSSAYYKFTYTTDAVVSKSLGFYIGCTINEQL